MREETRVTLTEELREGFRKWLYEREHAEATIRKYLTGIRISELKYFTVENVERGRIEIWNKGKHRRIFLPTALGRRLLKYCRKKKSGTAAFSGERRESPRTAARSGGR